MLVSFPAFLPVVTEFNPSLLKLIQKERNAYCGWLVSKVKLTISKIGVENIKSVHAQYAKVALHKMTV